MDPIIPEKEEREAHRQGSTVRPRGNSGAPPPVLHWPVGVRGWLVRLALPGAMLLLIAFQYSTHSRDIQALETRIETLRTIPAPLSPAPGAVSVDSSPLADQVAQHTGLIRTLEQRLATQIVELDSLRTATSDNFTLLGAAPLRGTGSLDELHESLSTLKAEMAALQERRKEQQDQQQAAEAQEARLIALQTTLDGLGALPARLDDLAQRFSLAEQHLDQVAEQLDSAPSQDDSAALAALTGDVDNVRAAVDALGIRVSTFDTENKAALEQQQHQIAQLDTRVDAAASQTTARAAGDVDAVREQVAALKQRIDQLDSGLVSRIDNAVSGFDRQLADTGRHLSSVEEAHSGLQEQLGALQHSLDSERQRLTDLASAVESTDSDLEHLAGNSDDMDAVHRQLATQLAAIESLQIDNRDLAATLVNTAREIDRLRDSAPAVITQSPGPDDGRLNGFGIRLDDAVARLEHQEVTLNRWREELEERLTAGSGQASEAAPTDPSEITRIRETLALLKKQHPFVKFPAD